MIQYTLGTLVEHRTWGRGKVVAIHPPYAIIHFTSLGAAHEKKLTLDAPQLTLSAVQSDPDLDAVALHGDRKPSTRKASGPRRPKGGPPRTHTTEPIAESLIAAFGDEVGTVLTSDHMFGTPSLGLLGVSDDAQGVQWNAWYHLKESEAYVGVNLEGKTYDDWPIARLLERELARPDLMDVLRGLPDASTIQLIVHRDAWQISARPWIAERHIGASQMMVSDIDPGRWRDTVTEALDCLSSSSGRWRRARQAVTLKSGSREMDVSPHLQFRTRIDSSAADHGEWRARIATARRRLQPLYDFVRERTVV